MSDETAVPAPRPPEAAPETNPGLPPNPATAPLPNPLSAQENPPPRFQSLTRRKKRKKWTPPRPFAVTAAMRRYARVITDPDAPEDENERCQKAKISVRRFEIWRRKPEFAQWLHQEIQQTLCLRTLHTWHKIMRLSKEGNLNAAKLVVRRFDPVPKGRNSSSYSALRKFL